MPEKVISIEHSFEKVTFHVSGKDNFLNTEEIEIDVYSLAKLLILINKIKLIWKRIKNLFGRIG
ncbi:MAG: hypothetical protein ABI091_14815 [Ferruginibacter sp.]